MRASRSCKVMRHTQSGQAVHLHRFIHSQKALLPESLWDAEAFNVGRRISFFNYPNQ